MIALSVSLALLDATVPWWAAGGMAAFWLTFSIGAYRRWKEVGNVLEVDDAIIRVRRTPWTSGRYYHRGQITDVFANREQVVTSSSWWSRTYDERNALRLTFTDGRNVWVDDWYTNWDVLLAWLALRHHAPAGTEPTGAND